MNIATLADVLQDAGAVNAMQLDINPDWTNYITYSHPSPGNADPERAATGEPEGEARTATCSRPRGTSWRCCRADHARRQHTGTHVRNRHPHRWYPRHGAAHRPPPRRTGLDGRRNRARPRRHHPCRSREAGIHAVRLDLGDAWPTSMRSPSRCPGSGSRPSRAVVCNAGFQNPGRVWSEDGYEATVAVNYLAQLRLIDRLVPLLAPSARIVWTASGTHDPDEVRMLPRALESATLEELVHPRCSRRTRPIRDGFQRYAVSKLCVVRAVPFLALTSPGAPR
jgi:NAD(P)-dependent dehydrogenase (short-subunit alcohol dehydrogenase family)